MNNGRAILLVLSIAFVATFAILSYGPGTESDADVPDVASVEYDDSESNFLYVKFSNAKPIDTTVYDVDIIYGKRTFTSEYKLISNSQMAIDMTKGVWKDITTGSYKLTISDGANPSTTYDFDIVSLELRPNGTSFKKFSALLSTDSLESFDLPKDYAWNTEKNASGTWVDSLRNVDVEDYSLVLYAFSHDSTTLEIESQTSTAVAGGTAKVTLSVVNNPGYRNAKITVTYDRSVLTLTNVKNYSTSTITPDPLKSYPFAINISSSAVNYTVDLLLCLTFDVAADAEIGQYPVVVTATSNVPVTAKGCAITIGDQAFGDLDDNKRIDSADAAILVDRLVGKSTQVPDSSMDVNCDGVVNILDSLIMKKYVANEPAVFTEPDKGDEVPMDVKIGEGKPVEIDEVKAGQKVFLDADKNDVKAYTSSGAIEVTSVSDGRSYFVAPSSRITVEIA
jgi:hypothetical protein